MSTYVHDKAEYHMTGLPTGAPSWEHAFGPALYFLRWCLDKDFFSEGFLQDSIEELEKYRRGEITYFVCWENAADLVFLSDMLTDEGHQFALYYFEYSEGEFFNDLYATLKSDDQYPLFTEERYLKVKPAIDSRYKSWK